MTTTKCPECGSTNTTFKIKAQQWECNDCEVRFENVEYNSRPKRIFLSYPHRPEKHSQLVEEVARVIQEKGHEPWFDKNKITPGYDWRTSISKGVIDSDWMIIFMSEEALKPGGVCLDEVGIALHQKSGDETLLTVLLEDEAKTNPPISLTRVQWLDAKNFEDYYPKDRNDDEAVKKWNKWLDDEVTKLIRHIDKKGDITGEISALRRRLQPSAFVAEIAQSSQGFVGREWVFEQIELWKEGNRERRTFILQGSAGIGKSAIAAQLSQQLRDVIGIHFCKHNDASTKDAGNLVRTMAFQIASRNPEYRHWLLGKLQEDQFEGEKLQTKVASELFRELIANAPQINSKSKSRQLLVIDGLDEALDEQGHNKILELIRDEFKKLPEWLGVVVTTRPEHQIVAALPSSSVLEASNTQNLEDIRAYLNAQFDSLEIFASNAEAKSCALKSALEKSEGVMLYAAELVRAIKEQHLDPLIPEKFPVGLSGIYTKFMQRNFADIQAYQATSAKVLELIAASPLPLSDRLIRSILEIDKQTFNRYLKPLSSLLVKGERNEATTWSVFHKSFSDWLMNSEDIHDYQLEGDGVKQIGEFLYQQYQQHEDEVEFNDPEISWGLMKLLPLCLPELKVWESTETLISLSIWYKKLGWYSSSIILADRIVKQKVEDCGEEHTDTLAFKLYLAGLLRQSGDLDGAKRIQNQNFRRFREKIGADSPLYLNAMNESANLTFAKGDYRKSQKIREELLELQSEIFGSDDPRTIINQEGLANILFKRGYHEEGKARQQSVLCDLTRILGDGHRNTISAMSNLASMFLEMFDYDTATELQEKALSAAKKEFGDMHPNTLTLMNNLAMNLHEQGNVDKARLLHEQVFAIREKTLGPEHPETLLGLNNLALIYYGQGDYIKAGELQKRVLDAQQRILGAGHPETLNTQHNLANTLYQEGRFLEAINLQEKTLISSEKSLGPDHPDTISCRNFLLNLVIEYRDWEKAGELFEQSKTEQQKGSDSTSSELSKHDVRLALSSFIDEFRK